MSFKRIKTLAAVTAMLAAASGAVQVHARQTTSSGDERGSWLNLDAARVSALFLTGAALVWFVVDSDETDSK
jgi:hypothetical protein